MISKVDVENFLNENISILYLDSGQEIFTKGKLISISDSALTIETISNTLIIPFSNVLKVKIPRE